MALRLRRVITGHDANGKAVVKIDEVSQNLSTGRPGRSACVVWTTESFPVDNTGDADQGLRQVGTTLKNGTVFRVIEFSPGVAPRNHRTDSIDYAVVMSGEIDMELDDTVVHLKAGDVLVQRGTLNVGDLVVAGAEWGRVRALVSDTGDSIESAGPSTPVEVLGFSGTPDAGDRLAVVENEARAREVTDYRARQKREKMAARASGMRGSLEQMMAQAKTAGRKEFPLVVKADVQGSVEAIIGALDKLATEEVAARVLHSGVGGISESDVTLAEASSVPIIAFNVRANKEAREAAERAGIEIRYYNIIYDLVDDVKKAMSGLLAPTLRETMLGNAQILEIFKVSKVGNVAGCRVTDGTMERGANVRLIRDNVVIHEGKLSQLKRFKDDVREVGAGMECGMAFENYQDMRQGDVIECYRVETIQRSL